VKRGTAIVHQKDRVGYVVYENTRTKAKVRIWSDDLEEIANICGQWHSKKPSACRTRTWSAPSTSCAAPAAKPTGMQVSMKTTTSI